MGEMLNYYELKKQEFAHKLRMPYIPEHLVIQEIRDDPLTKSWVDMVDDVCETAK
jgi:hypothetical protein